MCASMRLLVAYAIAAGSAPAAAQSIDNAVVARIGR
jgi:hypothetical protein